MSYILDALRRAQAERQRGAVPDLHSPAVAGPAPLPPERAAPLPWLLLAALGLAVVAAGGWWLARPQAGALEGAAPATAVAPAPAPPGTDAALPPTAASAAAAAQPLTAPPPVLALPDLPASPPKGAAAAAGERARAAAGRAPAAAELPAARAPAAPAPGQGAIRQAPGAAAPAGPPPAARPGAGGPPAGAIFTLDELPPAVRAQLPALKLAGISYSANPLHRMAIINGQVLHEGEAAAPGLVLERIEPGRAVWRFRDYRWALTAP
ncbi:general secretion pathway protein B [Oryzisolibacter propanilivorax]|uniref:General secretion pathway protein B n=1 Tax=Oryzisolibacter propanilivorax TaxID=1527607 RepID=A0A1G9SA55_9BURK|nr:general secretion pathway protein GspB [Oryzisolibacter propanilivorax]SDM32282.1 general secretion pathway protein B [Oryzisolibacter propanilivorax]